MRAGNYLRELQSEFPITEPSPSESLKRLAEEIGIDNTQPTSPSDLVSDHLRRLGSVFPSDLKAVCDRGQLMAGLVGTSTVDAKSKKMEDGSYAIIIHLGFTRLVFYFARAIARVAADPNDANGTAESMHAAALDIAEVAWWYRLSDQAYRPTSELSPRCLHFASVLSGLADAFYIGHEVGHVWVDLRGRSHVQQSVPELPTLVVGHREEHLADGTALALLLKSVDAGCFDRVPADLAVAGAELVIRMLALLERLGFAVGRSHPPSTDRLIYLRRVARDHLPAEEFPIADLIATIFGEIDKLFDNSTSIDEAENEAIESLVDWLDEVFEALPHVDPDFLMPLALTRFHTIVPNHLLLAIARAVLREISDPRDRIAKNREVMARLAKSYTDDDIQRLIHRQEALLEFVRRFVSGGYREVFLLALAQNIAHLRTPPEGA